jgi:Protein of unknown function (DUF3562)
VIDETFEKRMRRAEDDVLREFDPVDHERVRQEFDRVSSDLLRDARVTDFVPVLASRRVRDILRSVPAGA